jgi:hypothetical protein
MAAAGALGADSHGRVAAAPARRMQTPTLLLMPLALLPLLRFASPLPRRPRTSLWAPWGGPGREGSWAGAIAVFQPSRVGGFVFSARRAWALPRPPRAAQVPRRCCAASRGHSACLSPCSARAIPIHRVEAAPAAASFSPGSTQHSTAPRPQAQAGGVWSGRCPARAHPVADACASTVSSRRCARARASSRVWCPAARQPVEQRSGAVTAVDQPSARPHHLCNSASCSATRTQHANNWHASVFMFSSRPPRRLPK